MEQANQIARASNRSDICTLVSVADHAGIGQIIFDRFASMLSTNDMIDFMGKDGIVLVNQTVLAPKTRALHHEGA